MKTPGSFLSVFSKEVSLQIMKELGLILNDESQCIKREEEKRGGEAGDMEISSKQVNEFTLDLQPVLDSTE